MASSVYPYSSVATPVNWETLRKYRCLMVAGVCDAEITKKK